VGCNVAPFYEEILMSHMIDNTTGRNAIAYVGTTPWHGLGRRLRPGADIDTWQREAGLLWTAQKAPVRFSPLGDDDSEYTMKDRHVLYRSDTKHPLSVVSSRYQPVQPREVLDWFDKIAKASGAELETAGSLGEGQRVWALAKVGEGANVIGHDKVLPYLLLATSYDGTMATVARFTAIRVVCHNTITAALNVPVKDSKGNIVDGKTNIVTSVTVPHSTQFDGQAVADRLGLVRGAFAQFLSEASELAENGVNDKQVDDFIRALVEPRFNPPKGTVVTADSVRQSRAFQSILGLFNENSVDNQLAGGKNAWALLNAVTRHVDHSRGRNRDSGLKSAWFGEGDKIKNEAKALALAL